MSVSGKELNDIIKQEANVLLYDKGLLSLLKEFGNTHISGSYSLDLMSWRDLDIYLESGSPGIDNHFLLGSRIANTLSPVKMNFRNEIISQTTGLPIGLYWGIYFGNERAGAWKIDIWMVQPGECNRLLKFCEEIQKQLTPVNSSYIMDIKSKCWQDPQYRKTYSSSDIYEAVLKNNITTFEDFRKYLGTRT